MTRKNIFKVCINSFKESEGKMNVKQKKNRKSIEKKNVDAIKREKNGTCKMNKYLTWMARKNIFKE